MEKGIGWAVKRLKAFSNNSDYSSLQGKRILFATTACAEAEEICKSEGAKDVVSLTVTGETTFEKLADMVSGERARSYDLVFCDVRNLSVSLATRELRNVIALLGQLVTQRGALFVFVISGKDDSSFDVPNNVVITGYGWTPGRRYLYGSILKSWAVRSMGAWWDAASRCNVALLRLTEKRPSLLLICAKSMAGKTTLARQLLALNPLMHVSNDFIYVQLVRGSSDGQYREIDPELASYLGDGSGEASGKFNRALESVPGLVEKYIPHLVASIPRGIDLVSVDMDLRTEEAIAKVKEHLENEGFSVWVVRR